MINRSIIMFVAAFAIGYAIVALTISKPLFANEEVKVTAEVPQQSSNADESAKNFYTWYMNCLNDHFNSKDGKKFEEHCDYDARHDLNTSMKNKLAIDEIKSYDPVFCATAVPASIDVRKTDTSGEIASAEVVLKYDNAERMVLVDMRKKENYWQITNVICPRGLNPVNTVQASIEI